MNEVAKVVEFFIVFRGQRSSVPILNFLNFQKKQIASHDADLERSALTFSTYENGSSASAHCKN